MIVTALDENKHEISVNDFFSRYSEFSYNEKLVEQTTRILKVLLRHLEEIEEIADKIGNKYIFSVNGVNRTYIVVFMTTKQAIVLIDIW